MNNNARLLEKAYNFQPVERKWYELWERKGLFRPLNTVSQKDRQFSMVIPPPNVTGVLHIGHALNNTLQDILIRYKRMDGYSVLWVPGTDHAGIATQNVVERQLAEEGLSRHDIGREKFIERVWQWKEKSGGRIIEQLKRLGCSCDWSHERFTMDKGLSRAVREVFTRLYKEGLIYKGDYIINWCPRCHTALADIEVEHEDRQGHLWHIKYPLIDADGKSAGQYITVATTRPETMLGDTAVAVNTDDMRYRGLIGKYLLLPLADRKISVIADRHVDPEFGTGAVKVTPAHDFNDFEIALRHNLPSVNIFDANARINENGGAFKGMERYEAREAVIKALKEMGLIKEIEPHSHAVGCCYRCKTVVEPRLSKQWFVKVEPLAKAALDAVKGGKTRLIPNSWFRTYEEWMTNIKDWCISRQIWWGHRIPAWECMDCGGITVDVNTPSNCHHCKGNNIVQEDDVLDTWFSSALWPFSTLGWPDETEELKRFYPTSVLITSFDILFFWVARMMMMGIHFMNDAPFKYVYLHALVRDKEGKKMSKSKGNVIDPLDIMEKYGTDAVRFTLSVLAAQGRDIKLSEDRIEGYKFFINKIWNATRLLLMNNPDCSTTIPIEKLPEQRTELILIERWILSRLMKTIRTVRSSLDAFDFDVAAKAIYYFFWHEFCDWYLEMIKPHIASEDKNERERTFSAAVSVLDSSLRMLHPFIPFVTEELWQHLPRPQGDERFLISARFPCPDEKLIDEEAEQDMQFLMSLIGGIRNTRAELNIPPRAMLNIIIAAQDKKIRDIIANNEVYIKRLSRVEDIAFIEDRKRRPKGSASIVLNNSEVFIPLKGLLDVEDEIRKLTKQEKKLLNDLKKSEAKLNNDNFLKKAPKEIVEKEQNKVKEIGEQLKKIRDNLTMLTGLS